MEAFKYSFKRREIKYLLTEEQYGEIIVRICGLVTPDSYGESLICNTYYDTPDRRLIRRSLDKPVYKEKLRLRSYGLPEKDGRVFVEIKKKFSGTVYKRRIDMEFCAALDYLAGKTAAPAPSQISREIDYFLGFYPCLAPSMMISYRRTAFFGKDDPELRVTFDRDIMWREDCPGLDHGEKGERLIPEGHRIMELKIADSIPLELSRILDRCGAYPSSFSKYGAAYFSARSAPLSEKNKKGVISA